MGAPPAPVYGPPLAMASAKAKSGQRTLVMKGKRKGAAAKAPAASSRALVPAAAAALGMPLGAPGQTKVWPWVLGGLGAIVLLWYFTRGRKGRRPLGVG